VERVGKGKGSRRGQVSGELGMDGAWPCETVKDCAIAITMAEVEVDVAPREEGGADGFL